MSSQNKPNDQSGAQNYSDPSTVKPVISATRSKKSAAAFRTISEVADELGVQQHVLRFWETKFSQIKPLKRGGGRRYYRPEDIELLKRIYNLLYTEGFTIKGVQKLLKERGKNEILAAKATDIKADIDDVQSFVNVRQRSLSSDQRIKLEAMLDELKELRDIVKPN